MLGSSHGSIFFSVGEIAQFWAVKHTHAYFLRVCFNTKKHTFQKIAPKKHKKTQFSKNQLKIPKNAPVLGYLLTKNTHPILPIPRVTYLGHTVGILEVHILKNIFSEIF